MDLGHDEGRQATRAKAVAWSWARMPVVLERQGSGPQSELAIFAAVAAITSAHTLAKLGFTLSFVSPPL